MHQFSKGKPKPNRQKLKQRLNRQQLPLEHYKKSFSLFNPHVV
nr:MAG TPA: hypothetical protein [Caudoviricetes sp.]